MQRKDKTGLEELGEAVEVFVDEILNQFEEWLYKGKDFIPDYKNSFLSKLKEKGLKITKDDE